MNYHDIGWNPDLVFLTVVFFNSTDLAVVIPNSTVKRDLFYSTNSWKILPEIQFDQYFRKMHNLAWFWREKLKK